MYLGVFQHDKGEFGHLPAECIMHSYIPSVRHIVRHPSWGWRPGGQTSPLIREEPILTIRERWARNNVSIGPTIPVPTAVSPLHFNIANQRVGQHKIGKIAWKRELVHQTRLLNQPELHVIIGTPESPKDPFKIVFGRAPAVPKKPSAQPVEDVLRLRKRKHPKRALSMPLEAAVADLQVCDPKHTGFVTAHVFIVSDYRTAYDRAREAKKVLQQLLNRNFPGHKAVFVIEVQQKLVAEIPASLIADNSWLQGLAGNHLVYDIHTHGVLYSPGHLTGEMADAFTFTPKGKRSRIFGGARQVHVEPLYSVVEDGKTILDVRGIVEYGTKNHFRPAVITRQLEGFPEWLKVQHQINNDPSLALISGMRKFKSLSDVRPTLKRFRSAMMRFQDRLTLEQRLEDSIVDDSDLEFIEPSQRLEVITEKNSENPTRGSLASLYSSVITHWNDRGRKAQKKFGQFVAGYRAHLSEARKSVIAWCQRRVFRLGPGPD